MARSRARSASARLVAAEARYRLARAAVDRGGGALFAPEELVDRLHEATIELCMARGRPGERRRSTIAS
jgi:hypothetical protein